MRLAFLAPLVGSASAAVIEHWWNISRALANPDGLFERSVIGVNGSWPPPAISCTQGDIIKIHAYNGLGDQKIGTALHAHGMFFNGTNYYDGAVGVTQCSIPSERGMDYIIDTSLQTGTYWIHGHYLGQYTDGLRAPLIIHPMNETGRGDSVKWDEEYTLVVSDWYHRQHYDLLEEFMSWKNPTGAEPVPDSAAIYVLHKDEYLPSPAAIQSGEGVNDNAKIHFEPGKTYKIRLINMSALAMFYISLDQHDIYIIETDGIEIEPYKLDVVTISVAQRYSILVTAKNETGVNYAMSIMQAEDMYDVIPSDLVLNNTVQIVYDETNEPAQKVVVEGWPVLDDTDFVPVLKREMAPADIEYELNVWFDTYDDGSNRGSFNNVTYREPRTPSLFTALTMGNDSFNPAVYGHQTNAIPYPHGANIQLTVYNWDDGFHPFHFHGHEFQVVSKSFDVTSDDPSINPPLVENQKNPARRDTITIPPSGKVVIRWRSDNPGAWFFHCHVDWHLSSGLAVVFIEAPEKLQESARMPQALYDQCDYWGLPTSGNVVGKNSTTDLEGQPWGPFPLVMNWTPKAIITMIACVITALLGFGTVIWYGSGDLDEAEIEEEVKRKIEAKKVKQDKVRRLVGI